ncbi:LpxI family protein [bacterium]|nr:MAG: LpxI family protein [bacterium]
MPLRSGLTHPLKRNPLITPKKTLGLIAGMGELPRAVASEAKKRGYNVIAIALHPPADESLKPHVDSFHKVHIGRFGEIIKILKNSSAADVVMAGKVPKSLLYKHKKSIVPDLRAIKVLFSLRDRSDSTFLQAITAELEKEGMRLLKATSFTKENITPQGVLTKKQPKKDQWNDIAFGWKMAKGIGKLDLGQTIVVKDLAVMAVEAIEGTDEAILRGGKLAEMGAVIVKVSKPRQDMRLDVPVVGTDTLSAMKKADAKILALEAGKSIIIDKEKFIKEANKAGISVVGISSEQLKS